MIVYHGSTVEVVNPQISLTCLEFCKAVKL